jgi:RNA polymerase sigma-70 factor (ECF subfamily)
LYRILVHATADETRRLRRFEQTVHIVPIEPAIGDNLQAIADREQLERGFRHLSIDHRSVIVLRHYLDLSMTETANTLGIPVGTAKSRYHYAMSALRAAIDAEGRLPVRREVPV